jgi:hypothetical protein
MLMNLLSIRLSYVVRLLGAAAILIVLVSIGGQLSLFLLGHGNLKGLVPLFYVGNEGNIPTGFSVLLMLVTCILLAVIALLKRKQGDSHASYWAVLFCGFLFMAYDEAFQVHEKLIAPVRGLLGDFGYGVFFYAWVLPGAALVIILWMFFRKFLSQLTTPARSRFLVAAFIYLGGPSSWRPSEVGISISMGTRT